jgi:hypothetical protein
LVDLRLVIKAVLSVLYGTFLMLRMGKDAVMAVLL